MAQTVAHPDRTARRADEGPGDADAIVNARRFNASENHPVSATAALRPILGVTRSRVRTPRRACTVLTIVFLLGGPALAAAGHAAGCTVQRAGELQVTMNGTRPLVHAGINGKDAIFVADTGASYSTLNSSVARDFKLDLEPAPVWFAASGVAGEAHTMITQAKIFNIFGLNIPRIDFVVVDRATEPGLTGLLGQNVFRLGDMEFDLAHSVIRLLQTHECGSNDVLAYWAAAESKPFAVIDIDAQTRESPQVHGDAYINGVKVRVLFDTGAYRSFVTLKAAERVGVTPSSLGATAAGRFVGIGGGGGDEWIAPFASFKIGDEEIRNTRLRIGGIKLTDTEMILGADFFLSHHVLVATSQKKLYFTYNGGKVFDLSPVTPNAPAAAAPASQPGAEQAAAH
jgi:predicted aspartyl protease